MPVIGFNRLATSPGGLGRAVAAVTMLGCIVGIVVYLFAGVLYKPRREVKKPPKLRDWAGAAGALIALWLIKVVEAAAEKPFVDALIQKTWSYFGLYAAVLLGVAVYRLFAPQRA